MEWLKNKVRGSRLWLVIAFICVVPYLAFQNMKERTALPADPKIPGLKVQSTFDDLVMIYQDGSKQPFDGFAFTAVTAEDYQANSEVFKKSGYVPQPADLPVVVFFNLSGFDPAGDPGVIRRAKDGIVVFELKNKPPKRLLAMAVMRDGTFQVFFRDGTNSNVDEVTWYRDYMGIESPVTLPPQDKLDKMTPEELAKLGLSRVSAEEYEKKFGVKPPEAATPPLGGLSGAVARVGGIPAVQPVEVDMLVLKGEIGPADRQQISGMLASGMKIADIFKQTGRAAATTKTDKNGRYEVALPPGQYTVVIDLNGRLLGNALNQEVWPSVTVGTTRVDYDFRVSP